MNKFKFSSAGFDSLFVLAVAIFSYAIPTMIGGNGYLSAYIAGLILGNKKNKENKIPDGWYEYLYKLSYTTNSRG